MGDRDSMDGSKMPGMDGGKMPGMDGDKMPGMDRDRMSDKDGLKGKCMAMIFKKMMGMDKQDKMMGKDMKKKPFYDMLDYMLEMSKFDIIAKLRSKDMPDEKIRFKLRWLNVAKELVKGTKMLKEASEETVRRNISMSKNMTNDEIERVLQWR